MTDLPKQYAWLETEPGPRILVEALKTYGTIEKPGEGSNPSILAWAKVTGLDRIYRNDATAWCGLAMAYVAGQAGWDNAPRGNALMVTKYSTDGTRTRGTMNNCANGYTALLVTCVFNSFTTGKNC